ncbi:hypothetical protein, partial [Escherichia coli]|uniref:hypothetical protein n=1 Tax=Escherichia coli TaxID=562 RepID=UPI0022F04B60
KTQPATGETYPKSDLFNKADMYVPNPLKNNIKLYYKETESESHRVIIDNILKLKQLTRICMR